MKTCTKCKINKSLDSFYSHSGTKDGVSTICKLCIKGYYKYKKKRKPTIKGNKKKCNKCNKWSLLDNYHWDNKREYYLSTCKSCRNKIHKKLYKRKRSISVRGKNRRCVACNKWLNQEKYFQQSKGRYNTVCKNCINEYYRDDRLKRLYGLERGEYDKMYKQQDGKCAICGEEDSCNKNGVTRTLSVDHCHNTGKIRGLLCNECNIGLGKFKDNRELLEKAIKYLK